MPEALKRASTLVCYPGIVDLAYEAESEPAYTIPTTPLSRRTIESSEEFVIQSAAGGVRLAPTRKPKTVPFILVAVPPLPKSLGAATRRSLAFLSTLITRRMRGLSSGYSPSLLAASKETNDGVRRWATSTIERGILATCRRYSVSELLETSGEGPASMLRRHR